MNRLRIIAFAFTIFSIIGLTACDGYFGEKTDLDFIEIPDYQSREVAYVPIQPVLDNFIRPTDVLAGFDNLIYVADNGAEEIVCMDEAGNILSRYSIPGATKVIQDRSLDLLAIGTKDTIISGYEYSLTCIYRLDLKGDLGYGLRYAEITNEIVHPFYFKTGFSTKDQYVTFSDISIIGDNDFYVSRTGTSNNLNQIGGPDDAVLLFGDDDVFQTPITVTASGSSYRDYFSEPSAIVTQCQPPQISANESRDFIVAYGDDETEYKIRYIEYFESDLAIEYNPGDQVAEDTSKADGFITEANKFSAPSDITISGDGTNYVFVLDTDRDSLYQFTYSGLEGVQPPAGAASTKYVKTSFGGEGVELTQFNNPQGVAYFNEIVYVADTDNGRVLRFKLTSDFE